jgi:hypothetical protein
MKKLFIAVAVVICVLAFAIPALANESTAQDKLRSLQSADGIMSISESTAGKVIFNASRLVATIFFMYELIKRYLKTSLGQERMNTGQLITRLIVVVVAMGLYKYAFEGLYKLIDLAADAVRGGADYYTRINEYRTLTFQAVNEDIIKAESGGFSIWALFTNALGSVLNVLRDILMGLLTSALSFIAQISFEFIELYRYVWLLFLELIGPLAIATLVTEDAKRIGIGWIENLINVLLWPFWLTIIMEVLMHQYAIDSAMFTTGTNVASGNYTGSMAVHIITIFLTLSVPGLLPRIARGAGIKAG